jgi:hypothetical protein
LENRMQCWQNVRLVIDAKRRGCHHRSGSLHGLSLHGVTTIRTNHLLFSVSECATPRQAISSNKKACLQTTLWHPSYSYSMKWYSYSYSKIPHRVRVPLSLSTSTKNPGKTRIGTPRHSDSATSKAASRVLSTCKNRLAPQAQGNENRLLSAGSSSG